MSIAKQFSYEDSNITVVKECDDIWFRGKDVAEALGYIDTDQAIRKHVENEDKLTRRSNGLGQNREHIFLNEPGLYSLIFSEI